MDKILFQKVASANFVFANNNKSECNSSTCNFTADNVQLENINSTFLSCACNQPRKKSNNVETIYDCNIKNVDRAYFIPLNRVKIQSNLYLTSPTWRTI